MADDGVRLTREELYRLVWERPTTRLAGELGISDVALGKICRRMSIPKPPLGYWRKVESGQHPPIPPLPALEKNTPDSVLIPPRLRTDELALTDPQVSERLAAERLPENRIVVAETLSDPHPLITRMLGRRDRGAPGDEAGKSEGKDLLPDVEVSDGALDRALRVMDAVLKAVEVRG